MMTYDASKRRYLYFLNSFLQYILFKAYLTLSTTTLYLFHGLCVLNFGQLLFLLGNEGLKNNIRNIQKINKLIVHLKSGIHFNEIYIYKI